MIRKENFGTLPGGQQASLYTISCGALTASVTDFGAALVRLWVPDARGNRADVVLGYDDAQGYLQGNACLGATVGRNANRVKDAAFRIGNTAVNLTPNQGPNNLHSGPDPYYTRLWEVERLSDSAITLRLHSPHGDQGFPGNAVVRVTYTLEYPATLRITYDAVSDRDTVFNMTNHSYFNLAGHENCGRAMEQTLMLPARFFSPDDAQNIPTGELRGVEGTPMDFRVPKPLGKDLNTDYVPLQLQGGIDHNFEVFCQPCAILEDPASGRQMAVFTDCPGIQVYTANFTNEDGKDGVHYGKNSAVALETQFYPDSVNHPEWPQPFVKAGRKYHSETAYRFSR